LKNKLENKIKEEKVLLTAESIIKTYKRIDDDFEYENSGFIRRWWNKMTPPEEDANVIEADEKKVTIS